MSLPRAILFLVVVCGAGWSTYSGLSMGTEYTTSRLLACLSCRFPITAGFIMVPAFALSAWVVASRQPVPDRGPDVLSWMFWLCIDVLLLAFGWLALGHMFWPLPS